MLPLSTPILPTLALLSCRAGRRFLSCCHHCYGSRSWSTSSPFLSLIPSALTTVMPALTLLLCCAGVLIPPLSPLFQYNVEVVSISAVTTLEAFPSMEGQYVLESLHGRGRFRVEVSLNSHSPVGRVRLSLRRWILGNRLYSCVTMTYGTTLCYIFCIIYLIYIVSYLVRYLALGRRLSLHWLNYLSYIVSSLFVI
jgi:hypothetical protein